MDKKKFEKWSCDEKREANKKLNAIFGFSYNLCSYSPLLGFGVVFLDDWLHKEKGYEEEKHGSMRDFIEKEYGVDVAEFVSECIEKC